jgi:hypothetical protein
MGPGLTILQSGTLPATEPGDNGDSGGDAGAAPGVGEGGGGGGGCFIATAAYGSHLAPEVQILRQFRDDYLMTNSAGRWLVRVYCTYSPPVARAVAASPFLAFIVRLLLAPIVYGLKYPWLLLFALALVVSITAGLRRPKRGKGDPLTAKRP